MSAGDPLAGLPRPLGDPGVTAAAGRRYSAAAEELNSNATQALGVVKGLAGSDWVGAGASSAVGCTVVLAGAMSQTAEAAHTAGAALGRFSTALTHAQSQWDHARSLANQALNDESTYRSNAEAKARSLDTQASAGGNLGAAHAAASIRADAASYTSPLRARAIQLATDARQAATTAGNTAAAAVGEAAAMVRTPPPAPTTSSGVDAGAEHDSLLKWFNDYVLGGFNTGASLLTLPPAALAAGRWGAAARSAAGLPRDLQSLWDATIGPLALAADRDGNWAPVAARADNFFGASRLFQETADSRLAGSRLSFLRGGLPDSPVFDVGSKVLGGVGILGDVGTFIDPGGDSTAENAVNRGASVVNAGSTLLVINAAGDEIPVAGEVIMVGSGVYLGGDWLYHHWTPFHDGVDATGHFVTSDVPHFFTDTVPSGLSTVAHGAGHVLHDVEPWNW